MAAEIPDRYRDLFTKPAFAHLATLMPDGTPQVTPVWCDLQDGLVLVNTARGRQKDRNLRRDPRVALAISDPSNPYRYLQIRGKIYIVTNDIPALLQRYAKDFPEHRAGRAR